MSTINYEAPPTIAAFIKSDSFGRLIAGPVGSGKTTGCLFELFRRACEQEKGSDGFRYTRFAIVRQTLKQLKDTVLKDILSWLKGMARFKVSDNTIYIEIGDVRSEWLLIPLDDPEDQRRLLSMQLTGAWMSECIEMELALVSPLSGRCGRYPTSELGYATWMGIIADTNMPTEGSDWHQFMELPPPDWQVFFQPGGLTADAENLNFLTQTSETVRMPIDSPERLAQGRIYYERLARSNGADWVNRFVHAQYGNDPSGTAVFRDSFRPAWHGVEELEPIPGLPLLIGQDFGRDPWSIICQLDHMGRFLVLEEVAAVDTGLEQHIIRSLRPTLTTQRYMGHPIMMIGDPAGIQRSTVYEETTFDVIKRMGLPALPAPSNDIDPRIRAVETFLLSGAGTDGRGFLIHKGRCPTLFRALSGGYRYANTKQGIRKPKPDKNSFSHPADALQYACLAAHGGMMSSTGIIAQRLRNRSTTPRIIPSSRAWS